MTEFDYLVVGGGSGKSEPMAPQLRREVFPGPGAASDAGISALPGGVIPGNTPQGNQILLIGRILRAFAVAILSMLDERAKDGKLRRKRLDT